MDGAKIPDDTRAAQRSRALADAVVALSSAGSADRVRLLVAGAARRLVGADGATLVLREGDECHYVDEDAIAPLWRGQRFSAQACVSGWAMTHRRPAVIADVFADVRVPQNAYRDTFVRSMAMLPVRRADPIAAIGVYWAETHRADEEELELLQALADSTALALENHTILGELERRVEQRTAELAASAALNASLLRTLAHEVGNPLAATDGLLELVIEDAAGMSAQTLEDLRAARAAVRSGLHVVGQQLELVKLRGGTVQVAQVNVDAAALVRTLVTADRAAPYRAPGVDLRSEVVGPIPRLRSDPELLSRVLRNLLSNALKFTVSGEVCLAVGAVGRSMSFVVGDTGIGIPLEAQQRIFEDFERVDTPNVPRRDGCGLGLPLARGLTELLGGTLTLTSHPGAGTRVEVCLPLDGLTAGR